jgi:hypothetical protein
MDPYDRSWASRCLNTAPWPKEEEGSFRRGDSGAAAGYSRKEASNRPLSTGIDPPFHFLRDSIKVRQRHGGEKRNRGEYAGGGACAATCERARHADGAAAAGSLLESSGRRAHLPQGARRRAHAAAAARTGRCGCHTRRCCPARSTGATPPDLFNYSSVHLPPSCRHDTGACAASKPRRACRYWGRTERRDYGGDGVVQVCLQMGD